MKLDYSKSSKNVQDSRRGFTRQIIDVLKDTYGGRSAQDIVEERYRNHPRTFSPLEKQPDRSKMNADYRKHGVEDVPLPRRNPRRNK